MTTLKRRLERQATSYTNTVEDLVATAERYPPSARKAWLDSALLVADAANRQKVKSILNTATPSA